MDSGSPTTRPGWESCCATGHDPAQSTVVGWFSWVRAPRTHNGAIGKPSEDPTGLPSTRLHEPCSRPSPSKKQRKPAFTEDIERLGE